MLPYSVPRVCKFTSFCYLLLFFLTFCLIFMSFLPIFLKNVLLIYTSVCLLKLILAIFNFAQAEFFNHKCTHILLIPYFKFDTRYYVILPWLDPLYFYLLYRFILLFYLLLTNNIFIVIFFCIHISSIKISNNVVPHRF